MRLQAQELIKASQFGNGSRELTNLKDLNLNNKDLEDISELRTVPNVNVLNLAFNKVKDINPIADLTMLHTVNLMHNNLQSVTAIGHLTALTTLRLSNNKIENIEALCGCVQLQELWLNSNKISDLGQLRALSGVSSLERLMFKPNPACSNKAHPTLYKNFLIQSVPSLTLADGATLTDAERKESSSYMAKPSSQTALAQVTTLGGKKMVAPAARKQQSHGLAAAAARGGRGGRGGRTSGPACGSAALRGGAARNRGAVASQSSGAGGGANTGVGVGAVGSGSGANAGANVDVAAGAGAVGDEAGERGSGGGESAGDYALSSSAIANGNDDDDCAGEAEDTFDADAGLAAIRARLDKLLPQASDFPGRPGDTGGIGGGGGAIVGPAAVGVGGAGAGAGAGGAPALADGIAAAIARAEDLKNVATLPDEFVVRYKMGGIAVTIRSDGSAVGKWPGGGMAVSIDGEKGGYRIFVTYRRSGNMAASFDPQGNGVVNSSSGKTLYSHNVKQGGMSLDAKGKILSQWNGQGQTDDGTEAPPLSLALDDFIGVYAPAPGMPLRVYMCCEGVKHMFVQDCNPRQTSWDEQAPWTKGVGKGLVPRGRGQKKTDSRPIDQRMSEIRSATADIIDFDKLKANLGVQEVVIPKPRAPKKKKEKPYEPAPDIDDAELQRLSDLRANMRALVAALPK